MSEEKQGNIRKIFTKDGLFSSEGRRNRMAYFVANVLIGGLAGMFFSLGTAIGAALNSAALVIALVGAVFLFFTYVLYNNAVKRCHDLDRGANLATILVAANIISFFATVLDFSSPSWKAGCNLIAIIINIYLTFFPGTRGPNQYGDDPVA